MAPIEVAQISPDELLDQSLRIKRNGNQLIIKTSTATIYLHADRWRDVVDAIQEVCIGTVPQGTR